MPGSKRKRRAAADRPATPDGSAPGAQRNRRYAGMAAVVAALLVASWGTYLVVSPRPAPPSSDPTPLMRPPSPPQPSFLQGKALAVRLSVGGLSMEASAVEPQVFHLVVALPGPRASGPASPFVVENGAWSGARFGHGRAGAWIGTPAGRLSVSASGALRLEDRHGKGLLWSDPVRQQGQGLALVLHHRAGQRFYGGGNAGLGLSGSLVQTSGTSAVGNGYTRIPFLWSTGGYGLFIANDQAGVSWRDTKGVLRWAVPAGFIDLYLIAAPTPYGLLDAYTRLTGRPAMPPDWALGYLQSRWGYANAADVRDKWYRFRRLRIPVSAFIYDYDWFTDDWHFNLKTFPDPAHDLAQMHALGLHFVGICKPRVHGPRLDYARHRGWVLVGADLRFDLPECRAWWWSQHVPLVRAGVDGWWNDEAENAYDQFFYMNLAEWDGWHRATRKPFWSLSRAFAPGQQRFGACWTGDIPSTWQALQNQPGTLLEWGMCGMPFCGQDIGGFSGTPTPELYVRWMEEGALVPIMRAHGIKGSPRWPWAFGPPTLRAVRAAISLRERLRPYLTSCMVEAARTGAPVMRPLFFEFPHDPNTYNLQNEWMLGQALLAAPVMQPEGRSVVYLPRGVWYDFHTHQKFRGPQVLRRTVPLDAIPLFAHVPGNGLHEGARKRAGRGRSGGTG